MSMLSPKRTKFRKFHKGHTAGLAKGGDKVSFGDFGMQVLEPGWLTARQIEAGRVAATHFLQREGKIYVRVFPDKPISKKPLETRMGTGKADVDYWAARIKPGTILFELAGVPETTAKQVFARVACKMPCDCRMVGRRIVV